MFWKKKKEKTEPQKESKEDIIAIENTVSELAEFLLTNGLNNNFREKANQKALNSSDTTLSILKSLFHKPPKSPSIYNPEVHGLGGWLSACQFSIFELLYNLKESALPLIRSIAWGKYDWTQGNAIELLIRFAAEGIQTEEIIEEISSNFPELRDEAQLYALQPLLPEIDSNFKLKSIFEELMKIESFKESYQELTEE